MNTKTKLILYTLILLISLGFFTHTASAFTCGSPVTFNYNGAQVTYGTVVVGPQCWMDRNLGALGVAGSYNDTNSYGDYFQWGRPSDGHQLGTSATSPTLSTTTAPGHNQFIVSPSSPYDWLQTRNDNLWGSANSYINNPCPSGWHVPTKTEWQRAMVTMGVATCSSDCRNAMANSVLKIPVAGYRYNDAGTFDSQGSDGLYWSSSPNSTNAYYLRFNSSYVDSTYINYRALGYNVRCVNNGTMSPSDAPYFMDNQGYSNVASDDNTNREILQNVQTKLSGTAVSANDADFIGTGVSIPSGDTLIEFGNSLSSAGDVNGDGYGDVIVGAKTDDSGGTNAGRAYIFYGGPSLASKTANGADIILTGSTIPGDMSYFGSSVSSAGDINGDGYSDVIVGANSENSGGSEAGRAYIFYGGPSLANKTANGADIILTGSTVPGDYPYFGNSVSSAGDVNGDGYSDVIVGARDDNSGGIDTGRVYIFYGGPALTSKNANGADIILTGVTNPTGSFFSFGNSVSSAGDVNGDGYGDVIVGAYKGESGFYDVGRAYIFYGGPNLVSKTANGADIILTGSTVPSSHSAFGFSVSSAGDVNGDGYSDVIVGAYLDSAGGSGFGRAYIFYGGPSLTSRTANGANIILAGASASDYFGWSVSSAGDVSGDGYSDVIVGAYQESSGGSKAGRAYIFYGGPNLANKTANGADIIMTGVTVPGDTSNYFGSTISSAGDVNGDGYNDVIVGAYQNNSGGLQSGRIYIFYGSYSGLTTMTANGADMILTGLTNPGPGATAPQFGRSVSLAGDVNGDGYSDVIVGAPYEDSAGSNAGRAYIFYGGSSLASITANGADVIISGVASNSYFGGSVASAGDINGDGYSDVIVGANGDASGGPGAGRAYIFYGGPNLGNKTANGADVILTGVTVPGDADTNFGFGVSSADDVNGDGYSDVIVGAYRENSGGTQAGRVYIFYGGPSLTSRTANGADIMLTGVTVPGDTWTYFGGSVASAGDVNGDGYSDVIVGAYRENSGGPDAGRAYIFYGGTNTAPIKKTANEADIIFTGVSVPGNTDTFFGVSVSSVGDVNGDGYSDVIIGASQEDSAGSSAGRAYIFYGGPGLVSKAANGADVILTGSTAPNSQNTNFGYSTSSAGDVNDDGYGDVIVGAYKESSSGTEAGRSYIFYGGPGLVSKAANEADVILSSFTTPGYNYVSFGFSVSSAGDINGDGYSDVIVGAYGDASGCYYCGRAYIFLGGGNTAMPVFNFANKSSTACGSLSSITGLWNGQSSVGAGTNAINLQVYDFQGIGWTTVTTESSLVANTDQDISKTLNSSDYGNDLSRFCDSNNWSYWRVYQASGYNTLRSDYYNFTATGSTSPPANNSPTVTINTTDGQTFTSGTPPVEFTGADIESDHIRYNIQICNSADSGCASPRLDKVSGTDSGFTNTENGSDPEPYTAGQKISYTVQSGDSLPDGTYYYRVRGIDPSGSNAYGSWASIQNFVVSSGGEPSGGLRRIMNTQGRSKFQGTVKFGPEQ